MLISNGLRFIFICSLSLALPCIFHWARHTGATLFLNLGVPMEIVAKILGHASTDMTRRVYAKLFDDTVAKEMQKYLMPNKK